MAFRSDVPSSWLTCRIVAQRSKMDAGALHIDHDDDRGLHCPLPDAHQFRLHPSLLDRHPCTFCPVSKWDCSLTRQLVLLSPCAFLAQDYMILPRLATWLDAEDCLFLKSRLVVRVFVWSDVVTFLLQMAGSGMTAVQSDIANVGHYVRILQFEIAQMLILQIVIVGLVIQLCSFSLFVCLAITFGFRVYVGAPLLMLRADQRSFAPPAEVDSTGHLADLERHDHDGLS